MKVARAGVTVAAAATLALLSGCELVAGIDDRALGQTGGAGGSATQSGGASGGGGSGMTDGGLDHPLGVGGAGGVPAGSGGRSDAGNDAPGGATGTGGVVGTGGVTSSGTGGRTGTGGATGSGGTIGTGGVTAGTGGTGAGGRTGTGGAMGTGGVSGTGGATTLPACDPSVQNNNLCVAELSPTCNRICGLDLRALAVARALQTCVCAVDGWSCVTCVYSNDPALACFHLPSSLVACPRDGAALLKTGTSTCTPPAAGSCGAICGSTSVNSYQDATGNAQVGACACVAGVWQCAPANEWPP